MEKIEMSEASSSDVSIVSQQSEGHPLVYYPVNSNDEFPSSEQIGEAVLHDQL